MKNLMVLALMVFFPATQGEAGLKNSLGVRATMTRWVVDRFDDADGTNDVGGLKGAMEPAREPPFNSIAVDYDTTIRLGAAGSSLKLQYTLTEAPWNGFWNHLAPGAAPRDLSIYRTVVFWIRGGVGGGEHLKLELSNAGTKGIVYLNDAAGPVTNAWREIRIPLASFTAAGLGSLTDVKEFNFVFESGYARTRGLPLTGAVFIDGLEFSTLE